jgi:hypothetical protein
MRREDGAQHKGKVHFTQEGQRGLSLRFRSLSWRESDGATQRPGARRTWPGKALSGRSPVPGLPGRPGFTGNDCGARWRAVFRFHPEFSLFGQRSGCPQTDRPARVSLHTSSGERVPPRLLDRLNKSIRSRFGTIAAHAIRNICAKASYANSGICPAFQGKTSPAPSDPPAPDQLDSPQ